MISRNFCLITAVRFFRACQKSEFEVKFENIISSQQSHWNLLKKAENPWKQRLSALLAGVPKRTWTSDPTLRRRVLYPTELLGQVTVAIIPVFRPDCKCPLQFCARFLILQDGHEPLHGLRLRGNLRQYRTIPALRLKHRSGGCGT